MVDIRRAAPPDLVALVDLHHEFCRVDGHPFDERRALAAFAPLLDDDLHGVVWIVDAPSAYAVITWGWSIEAGGAEGLLDEFFVTERDRGVGSAVLDHALDDGRQRGLARMFLETESHNERVRRFYERHGFRSEGSIWLSHDFVDLS